MISDVLRLQFPDAKLPEPCAEQPRKWHRFPCLFCGKDRAAINYALDLFVCHHEGCRARVWGKQTYANPGSWPIGRFRFQLDQAIRNIKSDYGEWLEGRKVKGRWIKSENQKDLEQHARMTLVEYERSGQLDTWEADVCGDPDQLDRYVLKALNCDLIDFMRSLVRSLRRESLYGADVCDIRTQLRQEDESVEDDVTLWIAWPTLKLRFKYQLTYAEIARVLGVSESTAKRRYRAEMADAEAFYRPEKIV